ncbi:hypothetical protein EJB05_03347, partial [Eragrostis curvula]
MTVAVPGGDLVPGQPRRDADHNKSRLMGIIRSHYEEALRRLPPSLIPRAREVGLCFGFFDPLSNIILNTFFHGVSPDEKEANRQEQRVGGEKRKRSQAGTWSKSTEYMEMKEARLSLEEDEISLISTGDKSIVARSLQGLVTFLTSFFRYLHTRDALFYLAQAGGDLVLAVRIIQEVRSRHAFTTDHPTTKIALACAARAAMCPQPDKLVSSTIAQASRMEELHTLLQQALDPQGSLSNSTVRCISEICLESELHETNPQQRSVFYDDRRFYKLSLPRMCPLGIDHKLCMRRVLLDKIHGFYLEAISHMPTTLLRSRLHRALLMAGHCYGPFDPVNILLNTIWCDIEFPTQLEFEVDMIRMESLAVVELRSLDGLVAFCQAINPYFGTSESDILSALLSCDLILLSHGSGQLGYSAEPVVKCYDAFKSAANAAFHPTPITLAYFAASLPQAAKEMLEPLLKAKRLSPTDVQTISKVLSENHPAGKPVGKVKKLTTQISVRLKKFEAHQRLIRKRVETALQEHAKIKASSFALIFLCCSCALHCSSNNIYGPYFGDEHEYEIHAICGVNSEIPEDGKFGYFNNYHGYPFSHINVWVIRRGLHHADEAPKLLFIECSNDKENMEVAPFLCQISESTEFSGANDSFLY